MSLYLTQLSISYFTQVILALALTLYLFSLRNKSKASWLLTLLMVGTTGFVFGRFLYKSLPPHSPTQAYALFFEYLFLPLIVVPLVLFAYEFPRQLPQQRREYQIIKVLLGIWTVIALGVTFHLAFFQISSTHTNLLNLSVLFGNLWAIVVLLRRIRLLSLEDGSRNWLQIVIKPKGKDARGTGAYALAVFILMIAPIPSIMSEIGVISRAAGNTSQTILTLLTIFIFGVVYLNYAPEPTTITVKLVGVTLITTLAVFGILGFVVAPFYESTFQQVDLNLNAHTYQFRPQGDRYTATAVAYQFNPDIGHKLTLENDKETAVALPFSFPFFGKSHDELYISDNGIVTFDTPYYQRALQFGQQPAIAPLLLDLDPTAGDGVYVQSTPDQFTVTWQNLPVVGTTQPNTIQLQLLADGTMIMTHKAIAPQLHYGTDLVLGPWAAGIFSGHNGRFPQTITLSPELNTTGTAVTSLITPYQFTFRQYLHQRMQPLAILILIASLIITVAVPIFFHASLLEPLNTLVEGMGQINDGNLEVHVPVQYNDEIGFVTQSFNRMVQSVKQADALKDEFLANTSHELRTPLNGIVGLTESLLAGGAGPLSSAQARNLEMIALSGRRLTNLVNDVLDLARLKHHELSLQQKAVDLHTLTDVVLTISSPLVEEKPITLFNDVPADLPFAFADENRVQQILHNLIGNSIKFTPEGEIRVLARICENDPNFVAMLVSDTGIGIAEDKHELIFAPFTQADGSTARLYGGTGLGLSITRQLVELHGGTISFTSEEKKGAVFMFTLPIAPMPVTPAEAPRRTAVTRPAIVKSSHPPAARQIQTQTGSLIFAQNKPFTILVVDDEPINLQVVKNYLIPQGYHVITANDGLQALKLIESGLEPDLVILDIMMPHMTGYEVSKQLRDKFPPQRMPVVMLTAKNRINDLVAGFEAGANDYLTKPFSRDELLTRIRSHLQLAQTNRAYSRFVPGQILQFLERESIIDVQLGDQTEREMTVLFADVRDFTSLSEQMTPQENFNFLNGLLGRLGPLIRQNNGFIDKYMGDSIMALFPQSTDDALATAVAIQKALIAYNDNRRLSGHTAIRMGIGIHTGRLMLGTIGEEERMEGTVISDAVNTTSRIESLTKRYGVSILISEETLQHLSNPDQYQYRFLDRVKVKGKRGTVSVYEIFDMDENREIKIAVRELFEKGVRQYYEQDFATTISCMELVLEQLADDHAAKIYLHKAHEYAQKGVSDGWDGITDLLEK